MVRYRRQEETLARIYLRKSFGTPLLLRATSLIALRRDTLREIWWRAEELSPDFFVRRYITFFMKNIKIIPFLLY